MELGAVPYQAFPTYGYAINAATAGKASLPVSPSMVIYSQFKHVAGTPAPEGTQGVNISRLKILNTMIEQLEKMKGENTVKINNTEFQEELAAEDEKRINALIELYHQELKTAQNAAVYTPAAPETGALFNIAA